MRHLRRWWPVYLMAAIVAGVIWWFRYSLFPSYYDTGAGARAAAGAGYKPPVTMEAERGRLLDLRQARRRYAARTVVARSDDELAALLEGAGVSWREYENLVTAAMTMRRVDRATAEQLVMEALRAAS